ncbi:MAG: hypothetical protein AUG44_05850 [Actinobacteria bacterium 13_1_20CM_3_71_11]|nr:MAG: hypothetical protein AUG44_05850 [Actinobacteria bacterium 13_1_20CM_3_71_11]
MALVRVYCGLASAPPAAARSSTNAWLTVAVVDDAGRLIDVCDISDDPVGYAELGALLAERSGGTAGIAVATDSGEHQVTLLLAAAGRPLALAEEESIDDYAERFSDDESFEEVQAPVSERRAVGLARALQAGALAASAQGAPRELMALRPVLAAHAALATGRQGAAMALREVLRELYPAALRAYPDPAEPVPLAILDAVPEPGVLAGPSARAREEAIAAALADAGVADLETVSAAITSLRVAVSETPRRAGIGKTLTEAVADTIRHAVAAVRACDSGVTALVGLLAEKATPVTRPERPAMPQPERAPANHRAPVAPPPAPAAPAPNGALRAVRQSRPVAPPPPPEPVAPAAAAAPAPTRPAEPYQPAGPGYGYPSNFPTAAAAMQAARSSGIPSPRQAAEPSRGLADLPARGSADLPSRGSPELPARGSAELPARGSVELPRRPDPVRAPEPPRLAPDVPAPGSRSDWPLNTSGHSDQASVAATGGYPAVPAAEPAPGRVTPPWQADDLPIEPPALRLVEPDRATRPSDRDPTGEYPYGGTPPLRLVEPEPVGTTALDAPMSPPSAGDSDGDLLIFAETKSAWFTGHLGEEPDPEVTWSNPADLGWRAAERVTSPILGDETEAGLPRRVPAANLVPGSPLPPASERPLRILRDPAAMAQHTTGYFRGSRRGEEVRGFALGGRPGREAAGGWDFSRDGWENDDNPDRGYEYRSAARR